MGQTAAEAGTPEQRVGNTIRDKWHVDALIGIGGMAAVYSATHKNGRRAALKVLHVEYSRDAAIRERFLREGYVGNKVPHPGRVEVLDNDVTEDGAQFLIMELLEGETLDQIWKRLGRRMPLAPALSVAEQLLDFLSACHAQGIVHRDLKPANVFVTNEHAVKVLDFGIAQLRDETNTEHTRAGTTLGTPAYMSPEQARGLGDQLDGRSDLFSVGAMLYALLCGKRLHQGRTNDEALIMAATQPATSIARVEPDLPVEAIALIDKSLSWDRRNRFADAAEMRSEVIKVLTKIGGVRAPVKARELDVEDLSNEALEVDEVLGAAPAVQMSLATDDDPHVQRLRAVFKHLERLLPIVRQYGWAHPETERKLRGAFEEIVSTLAELPTVLHWTVRPYSFAHRGREVWEPTAPLDTIPYELFEAGLRVMRLSAGITEAELRALVGVMLMDPASDLAPEDDLSTVLWELSLPHVIVEVADGFAEGGAAQREAFYEESDQLEQLAAAATKAARAEAQAMAVSTSRDELGDQAAAPSTGGLDATTRLALSTQLSLSTERWTERYVDVLVDALLETRRAGDAPLVLDSLALSCADLVVAGRASLVSGMHAALLEVLGVRARDGEGDVADHVSRAMFGGTTFQLLLRAMLIEGTDRAAQTDALVRALSVLGAEDLPRAVHALDTINDERVRGELLRFVERVGAGHERELAARLGEWPAEVSRAVLQILARLRTNEAARILDEVAAGSDLVLKIEAIAVRASTPEQLRESLGKLAEHERVDVRLAALRAIAQHKVKELGPALVRRIEEPAFHTLVIDERRETFRTLYELNGARAEALAIEMLSQRQLLKSAEREQTRLLAAELLGEHARSVEAVEALQGAMKGRWGTSDDLRTAAQNACRAVEERRTAGGR